MTFLAAPLALDGARTPAALIRKGTYADTSGSEGIVERADLKVSPAAAGAGLLISAGNGLVLNRYQTAPNESYIVANPTTHTILPAAMPTSQPSAKSYLVMVTVGDPEFSQTGHPWMSSDPLDPEEAVDFQYVKPWLYEVSAGTTEFNGVFPGLVLARLDIPANTTTILAGYITDLRAMARPRTQEEVFIVKHTGANNPLNTVAPAWETWPGYVTTATVKIPKWASVAKIIGFIEGCSITKGTNGSLRYGLTDNSKQTAAQLYNYSAPTSGGSDRLGINLAGIMDVASIAGTTKTFRVEGNVASTPSAGGLVSDPSTTVVFRIRFEEAPI